MVYPEMDNNVHEYFCFYHNNYLSVRTNHTSIKLFGHPRILQSVEVMFRLTSLDYIKSPHYIILNHFL